MHIVNLCVALVSVCPRVSRRRYIRSSTVPTASQYYSTSTVLRTVHSATGTGTWLVHYSSTYHLVVPWLSVVPYLASSSSTEHGTRTEQSTVVIPEFQRNFFVQYCDYCDTVTL